MAASSERPSGGPSSSGPAGIASGPYSGNPEIGAAAVPPRPLGAETGIPPAGLVVAAGTRGNAGPGRPPSRASPAPATFSNSSPPAPGDRPRLVTPGSTPA